MKEAHVDGRTVRAAGKRKARREEILHVAEKLIGEKGYQATSVADVIEAAGISRGTFYLYFESREALFYELLDGFIAKLMGSVQNVRAEEGDVFGQMLANVQRVVNLLFDHRDLTIILFREAMGVNEEVNQKINDLNSFLYRMTARALLNGAKLGLIRSVNERVVAAAVIGSIKEVLFRYLVMRELGDVDRDAIARELLDYGLRGLQIACDA